jgi:hypothetical protein
MDFAHPYDDIPQKSLPHKKLCEDGLDFHEAWVMTLIGFATWLYLNLAENLEGKGPPAEAPHPFGTVGQNVC